MKLPMMHGAAPTGTSPRVRGEVDRAKRGRVRRPCREPEPASWVLPLRVSEPVERPPHPDPLPASGARGKGRCGADHRYIAAKSAGIVAACALAFAALLRPAAAQSVEEFYRGKNLTIAIGFSVGGGYDLYARLLARHIGKHIPGRPNVIAQNREGAGSQRATLYLYNAAPRDGTVIGAFSRSMAVAPLIADAPFDATKLTWLGSISTDVSVCFTWHTSPIKTFDDMLTTPFTMGGLGGGADPDIFALMLRNMFGARLKLVSGYPGTNDATLAMERGEVSGVCGISWSTVKSRHMDWVKGRQVNMPVQFGLQKEADIPDVPAVIDLVRGDEQAKMARLILAGQAMARPCRSAGHPGRSQEGAGRRVRHHHEGPGIPRRCAEDAGRRQSRDRGGDREAAGGNLRYAQGHRRQGRKGDRELSRHRRQLG
jgi:tripartite-type tricarboxylate transporter receptor subunit TctC